MSKLNVFTVLAIIFLPSIFLINTIYSSNQIYALKDNELKIKTDINEQENKCKKDGKCENENNINNQLNIPSIIQVQQESPTQLIVIKTVQCKATESQGKTNQQVCEAAETSPNFPSSEDYQIKVTANNPRPPSFPGSGSGIIVTLDAGNYKIEETLADTDALKQEFNAKDIFTHATVNGDCTGNFQGISLVDVTGTITDGETQKCTLINTVTIHQGRIIDTTTTIPMACPALGVTFHQGKVPDS